MATDAYLVRRECDDLDEDELIVGVYLTRKEANTAMKAAMVETLEGFLTGDNDAPASETLTIETLLRTLREGYEIYYRIVELTAK